MTRVRRTLSALGALISLAVSVPAAAACRDRADATEVGKRLAERGYEELAARRYGASEASFRASLECYESPASRFYLGRSLELQHKLLDAL